MESVAMSEQFTVEMTGGSPWGFSLQGGLDHRSPLRVGRVTPGGRAASCGLMAGDYILMINGHLTKGLKHLEAQQLIKNSKVSMELHCTKVRPGVTSPAVSITAPSPTFSFPTVGGKKPAPFKGKAITISKPPPPTNGHIRGGSLDTPSESTATTISTPSPSSSPCNVEVYDAKFVDLQCQDCSSDQTTPLPPSKASLNDDSGVVGGSTTGPTDILKMEEVLEEPSQPAMADNESSDPVSTDILQTEEVLEEPEPAMVDSERSDPVDPPAADVVAAQGVEGEELTEELAEELEGVTGIVADIQQQVEILKETVPQEASEAKEEKEKEGEVTGDVAAAEEVTKREKRRRSQGNSFTKRELVDIISQAAQARTRRESSSADTTSSTSSDEVNQPSLPKPAPLTVNKATPTTSVAAPAYVKPVVKPSLTKRDDAAPLLTKDTGWYQQMFQNFSNTVQETFPLAKKPDDAPTYVYDERGLKVRSGSVDIVEEAEEVRKKIQSPETPVYEYDDRGLRVPARSGMHVRGGSTPAVMVGGEAENQKQGTKFISVSSGGGSKEDILASNKKSTSYKSSHYSTGSSRNYWKQKDQDHVEFDVQRRRSQEQIFHRRNSSSDFTAKMTSMHPLLQPEMEDSAAAKSSADESHNVFERIDADKLQGALKNASVLTSLEHEGVPSHLLPALAQQQQQAASAEAAAKEQKKKALKAPPGPKAQANFNFQGKNEKELSFKKGDFINLSHTVDENWLEGSYGGKEGIFPANYVKVLTMAEYEELTAPKAPTPALQAKALFDFQGETQRELEFKKDDIVIIDKQVDDNWYSGRHGDKKGIFPVAYVQVIEQ